MKTLRLTIPESSGRLEVDITRPALWINPQRDPRLVMLEREGNELVLRDETYSSGTLHVVGTLDGRGPIVFHTAILMLRKEPYRLAAELARGQANKLRNLAAEWEREGWSPPDELQLRAREQASMLCQAIKATNTAQADETAIQSLDSTLAFGDELAIAYSHWRLEQRLRHIAVPSASLYNPEPTESIAPELAFVANVWPSKDDVIDRLANNFDRAILPIAWPRIEQADGTYDWDALDREVDMCLAEGIAPTMGPILDFRPGGVPTWLAQWESDPVTLVTLLVDIVESVVGRYGSKIKSWIVTSGTNAPSLLHLTSDKREWLTGRLLHAAEHIQPDGQFVIGLAQPWGWYAGEEKSGWPLDFVENILRSGVRPQAIQIDLRLGLDEMEPWRTVLDVSKVLGRFKRLSIPLWVKISSPAPSVDSSLETKHAEYVERVAVACLAKPFVEQVCFSSVQDDKATGEMTGLLRKDSSPRPILARLESLYDRLRSCEQA